MMIDNELTNTKARVNIKTSRQLQEYAFELGFIWQDQPKGVRHNSKPFLYFKPNGVINYGVNKDTFEEHSELEIKTEEFIKARIFEGAYLEQIIC